VKYFSGFSLHNEEDLFEAYISYSKTTVVGFSYGAQKAFDYVYETKNRVDRLILLSPAFFQTEKKSFIRTQLRYYDTNQTDYMKQFLLNTAYPSQIDISKYLVDGSKNELESLLAYQWDQDKIQELLDRDITIEVFLGTQDKLIDADDTEEFFSKNTTTYIIKSVGHLLKAEK